MNTSGKLTAVAAVILICGIGFGVSQMKSGSPDFSTESVSDNKAFEANNAFVSPQLTNTQTKKTFQQSKQATEVAEEEKTWQEVLPKQFQDTDVTGKLSIDEQGNLIVDVQARQVLDYFFTAQDDLSVEQITKVLEGYFDQVLFSPAREQATEFLSNYIEYKSQLNGLSFDQDVWERIYDPQQRVSQDDMALLGQTFQDKQRLQSELFDQEIVDALFADENAYDNYMLQRMQISLSGLPQDQMLSELSALDQQQGGEQARLREQSQLAVNHKSLDTALSEAGSADRYQAYSQNYGDEAADRLMALEQKRQAFNEKRQRYIDYRDGNGLASDSEQLQDFMMYELALSEGEMQRMHTLDQIGD